MMQIYALLDPDTNTPSYVGKTGCSLRRRLYYHIDLAQNKLSNRKVCLWIRQLLAEGKKPIISSLEVVPEANATQKEQEWYSKLKTQHPLLNATSPGGGPSVGWARIKWTPELDALLGKLTDPEIAAQVGATRKAVAYRRDKLGIPPVPAAIYNLKQRDKPKAKPQSVPLPEGLIDRLGYESDIALAVRYGLTKSIVATARRRRGIAPWDPRKNNVFVPKKLRHSYR